MLLLNLAATLICGRLNTKREKRPNTAKKYYMDRSKAKHTTLNTTMCGNHYNIKV